MTRFQTLVLGTMMLAVAGSGAVAANQAADPFKGGGANGFTGGNGNTVTASGSGQATHSATTRGRSTDHVTRRFHRLVGLSPPTVMSCAAT